MISRSLGSNSVMSLHSQFLQYMPFVGVITPTSRLHSVGSHNTKVFEKSRIPNSIEDLSIATMRQKKTYCNLEKKTTSSVRWQEGENFWWAYYEKMPGQIRHCVKVETFVPTSYAACSLDISSDKGVERGQCARSNKMGLKS